MITAKEIMPKRDWAEEALQQLKAGQTARVRPRGHSMQGRIKDGELVVIEPCRVRELKEGDIVLARIQGRRYSHLVLHQVLGRAGFSYLIGNEKGRPDGWVHEDHIYGKVTGVVKDSEEATELYSSEKEDAEFYRLSIQFGLKTVQEAVVWCDSIIVAQDAPEIAIIEASLLGSKSKYWMLEALKQVPGQANPQSLKRRIFKEMYSVLLEDRKQATPISRMLWDIATEQIDFPSVDEPEMWGYYDDLYIALDSREGPEAIIDDMIRFLEKQSSDNS